jgi:hypothetical protein
VFALGAEVHQRTIVDFSDNGGFMKIASGALGMSDWATRQGQVGRLQHERTVPPKEEALCPNQNIDFGGRVNGCGHACNRELLIALDCGLVLSHDFPLSSSSP